MNDDKNSTAADDYATWAAENKSAANVAGVERWLIALGGLFVVVYMGIIAIQLFGPLWRTAQ